MSEAELLAQLRKNEPTAGQALVARYGNIVYNTVLGLVQNQEDAEDLSQEVFVTAFQSVGQFRGEAKLSTWLYRIAMTKGLDCLRRRKRKKRFAIVQSLFEPGSMRLAEDPPHFQHPGVLLENRERAAILWQALDRLPEKQKAAFVLHHLEALPYAEIAGVMQVSLSSVESLLFRAKQNLQKRLGDYYEKNER